MARRFVSKWAQEQNGPVVGGSQFEGRLYTDFARTTLASLLLSATGATAVANPHSPNAGVQTSTNANHVGGDDTLTVLSTSGMAVGDYVPSDGSGGRIYRAIKTIVDATHVQLDATLGVAMNSGALVGGPEMEGHWGAWVDDTSDYYFTLKNIATGKEGVPEGVATLQTVANIAFQQDGTTKGTRGTLNFIGPFLTVTDNAVQSRVDVDEGALWAFVD